VNKSNRTAISLWTKKNIVDFRESKKKEDLARKQKTPERKIDSRTGDYICSK
jgi:hypothetical protein